jgi:hypothetical protein
VPRDNFSRRVARAAAVGGGRAYREQTPLTWYATLFVIVLLGISLVVYSRYERLHPQSVAAKSSVPPTATTEWQAALTIDDCGKVNSNLIPVSSLGGEAFTNEGNGIIIIAPGNNPDPVPYEGKNATLNAFLGPDAVTLSPTAGTPTLLSIPGKKVPVKSPTSSTSTTVPKGKKGKGGTSTSSTSSSTTSSSTTTTTTKSGKGSKGGSTSTSTSTSISTSTSSTTSTTLATKQLPPTIFKAGEKCPAGTPYAGKTAILEAMTWSSPTASQKSGKLYTSDISAIPFKNGELITIAYVPKGSPIPQPPQSARTTVKDFLISNPLATMPTTPTTTQPVVSVPSTSTPGSSSTPTSSTPASSTSTSKP